MFDLWVSKAKLGFYSRGPRRGRKRDKVSTGDKRREWGGGDDIVNIKRSAHVSVGSFQ